MSVAVDGWGYVCTECHTFTPLARGIGHYCPNMDCPAPADGPQIEAFDT